jgi:hypothetical protein
MRFVLVNGRTPGPQSFCTLCCEPIGGSYLRDIATRPPPRARQEIVVPLRSESRHRLLVRSGQDTIANRATGAIEVVGVAWGELESERPALIVRQGIVVRPPRERPIALSKAPLLRLPPKRWALMCVESTATVPIMPVEPVSA